MNQVFRSKTALVVGWIWMVFAAYNAVDLTVRYSGPASMVAAVVLGVLTVLVFISCLRPAIIMTEEGVLVRNPLRNVFVPWTGVDEITVSHVITITSGDDRVRCWTPQTTARERAMAVRRGKSATTGGTGGIGGRFRTEPVRSKGEQAAAEMLAGKTHADWVAEQLEERAEAAKRSVAATAMGLSSAAAKEPVTATAGEPASETAKEPATRTGLMKVTWSPSAMAALLATAILLVAAFIV
ncbi:PH domain-containing protein [Streptosporangium sp. 'caverna']|uniref:PH domain-containing protein n=1 Tax=Streptosporangium sp. 'caverna' TaxID=2202249 RepID=UPI000D7E6584|nr:PH domain-containing protein [Streptosporangium sp. 'caverna']AWS40738.1 hypothetical protein DKM19_04615 [Streptosporangium sp. 'caverna']